MSTVLSVKFFNSFWLKKTLQDNTGETYQSGEAMTDKPIWPSFQPDDSPLGGDTRIPGYPASVETAANYVWAIEETRVKGGFNNNSYAIGFRAYANIEDPLQKVRGNSLIYSGVINSDAGVNASNVFNAGEQITRTLDPAFGNVKKLFSENTNLTIFQENKVSQALIDKDSLYSADGSSQPVTSATQVIGTVSTYLGEYGIGSHPESFANFGMRKYFVDPYRSCVMRLSRDGLTEISKYGMNDYFRDELSTFNSGTQTFQSDWDFVDYLPTESGEVYSFIVSGNPCNWYAGCKFVNSVGSPPALANTNATLIKWEAQGTTPETYLITLDTAVIPGPYGRFVFSYKGLIKGAWDNYMDYYTVSLQQNPDWLEEDESFSKTITFDEEVKGWVSFFNMKPGTMQSIRGKFFSTKSIDLWQHNSGIHSNFYGDQYESAIEFVFNGKPSTKKVFLTFNYEGDNGWQVESIKTSQQKVFNGLSFQDNSLPILSYEAGLVVDPITNVPTRTGFNLKENLYVASIQSNSIQRPEEVLTSSEVSGLKGYFATVRMTTDGQTDVGGDKELWSAGVKIVQSS
mgnify:CR=1 FL=1